MRSTYKPCTPFRPDQSRTVQDRSGAPLTYTISIADVLEHRDGAPTGQPWHDGAHKVTFSAPAGTLRPLPRARTFIGETAWCDAQRYADDAATAHQFSRP